MPPLKPGEVADPFGNYDKAKDQSRVSPGMPGVPPGDDTDDGPQSVNRKRKTSMLLPSTRLKDVNP